MPALPNTQLNSSQKVIQFFDNYFNKRLEVNQSDYDATVGFFEQRGFGLTAAKTVSQVLLGQAKSENIPIFQLLDKLGRLSNPQLTNALTKILNSSRDATSQLGFKFISSTNLYERRNLYDPVVVVQPIEVINDDSETDYIQPGYVEIGYVE